MNFVGKFLDLLKQSGGLFDVASGVLAESELGHLVHQLGIQEVLFAWLRLARFGGKCIDGLLIEWLVVE
jgi:hypothetical protein